jgi:hypothetical protein
VIKLKSSLNKNVTTARVTSGKVEVISKQKVTTARATSGKVEVIIRLQLYH